MTEMCSECDLEEIACRCPPPTASLMGLLRDFRNANTNADATNGTRSGTGDAAAPDPNR